MMIDALYNYRQGDIHAAEFFIIHAEFHRFPCERKRHAELYFP